MGGYEGRHRPEYIAAMLAGEAPHSEPNPWVKRTIAATALVASVLLPPHDTPRHEPPANDTLAAAAEPERKASLPSRIQDAISRSTTREQAAAVPQETKQALPPQLSAEQKQLIASLRLSKSQKKFLTATTLAIMQTDAEAQGINPTVMLAQAILESGWGSSSLAWKYNNPFGMKYWKSDKAVPWIKPTPLIKTTEYRKGIYPYTTYARFRAFKTPADGFRAYIRDICRHAWYQDARRHPTNDSKYLDGLLNGNMAYATSANYKGDILSLIKRYRLYELA